MQPLGRKPAALEAACVERAPMEPTRMRSATAMEAAGSTATARSAGAMFGLGCQRVESRYGKNQSGCDIPRDLFWPRDLFELGCTADNAIHR